VPAWQSAGIIHIYGNTGKFSTAIFRQQKADQLIGFLSN